MTVEQVAKRLNVSVHSVRRWLVSSAKSVWLPNAFRLPSGQWRIPESDVEAIEAGRLEER